MNATKKLLIAAAVFAGLLLLVVMTHKTPYERTDAEALPQLPTIAKDAVDKVELTQKGESLVFEKKGADWFVTKGGLKTETLVTEKTPAAGVKADASFATSVVEKLAELALERVAGKNKDKHKSFELDAENAVTLSAYAKGQQLVKLLVGKNSADFRGSFVRLPDSDTVYQTAKSLGGSLKRSYKEWRDKSLFGLKAEELSDVRIVNGAASYTLVKKAAAKPEEKKDAAPDAAPTPAAEDKWELAGDTATLDKARVDGLLRVLAQLSWNDIVETNPDLATYGLTAPTRFVEFKSVDGKTHKLLLGSFDETQNAAWVQVEGAAPVYKIMKYQYEKFTQEPGFFKGEKSATAAPAPQGPGSTMSVPMPMPMPAPK